MSLLAAELPVDFDAVAVDPLIPGDGFPLERARVGILLLARHCTPSDENLFFYGPNGGLLFEFGIANPNIEYEIYFGGKLLGVQTVNTTTAVATPVTTMTDGLGSGVATYPYGTDIGTPTNSGSMPNFAGTTQDASTGLQNTRPGWYSPATGTSPTPASASMTAAAMMQPTTGMNKYSPTKEIVFVQK